MEHKSKAYFVAVSQRTELSRRMPGATLSLSWVTPQWPYNVNLIVGGNGALSEPFVFVLIKIMFLL